MFFWWWWWLFGKVSFLWKEFFFCLFVCLVLFGFVWGLFSFSFFFFFPFSFSFSFFFLFHPRQYCSLWGKFFFRKISFLSERLGQNRPSIPTHLSFYLSTHSLLSTPSFFFNLFHSSLLSFFSFPSLFLLLFSLLSTLSYPLPPFLTSFIPLFSFPSLFLLFSFSFFLSSPFFSSPLS